MHAHGVPLWSQFFDVLTECINIFDPGEEEIEKAFATHNLKHCPKEECYIKVTVMKDKQEYWLNIDSIEKGISNFLEENFCKYICIQKSKQ